MANMKDLEYLKKKTKRHTVHTRDEATLQIGAKYQDTTPKQVEYLVMLFKHYFSQPIQFRNKRFNSFDHYRRVWNREVKE